MSPGQGELLYVYFDFDKKWKKYKDIFSNFPEMFKHLSNGKVNVGLLQELALNELIYILEKCDGPKVSKKKRPEN
jgi:hypothetical protein